MSERLFLTAKWLDFSGQGYLTGEANEWRRRFQQIADPFHREHWGVLFRVQGNISILAQVNSTVKLTVPTLCCDSLSTQLTERAFSGPACAACKKGLTRDLHSYWTPPMSASYNLPELLDSWWSERADPLLVSIYVEELAARMNKIFRNKTLADSRSPDPAFHRLLAQVSGEL